MQSVPAVFIAIYFVITMTLSDRLATHHLDPRTHGFATGRVFYRVFSHRTPATLLIAPDKF